MENLTRLSELINEMSQLNESFDIIELVQSLNKKISELNNKILKLELKLEEKDNIFELETQNWEKVVEEKDRIIAEKDKVIAEKIDEIKNLNNVSMIKTLNSHLNEKNNMIRILEKQISTGKSPNPTLGKEIKEFLSNEVKNDVKLDIQKNKTKSDTIDKTNDTNLSETESENKEKQTATTTASLSQNAIDKTNKKEVVKEEVKKGKKKVIDFDPDEFEDINGYELTLYKKVYYLRNLETNELYSIDNNDVGEKVGYITSGNKVKMLN
jgi:hypothetical protein